MDLPKTAECPVCLELFTEPKVLNCGHSFCKKCLKPTPRGPTGQPKVSCPECRQESSVPAGEFATNYGLLRLVSSLESAGYRNMMECGECARKTPKAELFTCTTCEEAWKSAGMELEQAAVICGLCHKEHAIAAFNKPTAEFVRMARDKIDEQRNLTQQHVTRVRSELAEMTQEVMQTLEARVSTHSELSAQLGADNISQDDIEAKLAQSETHLAETGQIVEQISGIIDSCRRSPMMRVQDTSPVSQATAAQPTAGLLTISAAARPTLAAVASQSMMLADVPDNACSSIDRWRPLPGPSPRLRALQAPRNSWADVGFDEEAPTHDSDEEDNRRGAAVVREPWYQPAKRARRGDNP